MRQAIINTSLCNALTEINAIPRLQTYIQQHRFFVQSISQPSLIFLLDEQLQTRYSGSWYGQVVLGHLGQVGIDLLVVFPPFQWVDLGLFDCRVQVLVELVNLCRRRIRLCLLQDGRH